MKQETKTKIKKALKWTGFAVLCAFASFGSVVACSLIARSANGAEAQTAETSATKRADLSPRRANPDVEQEGNDNLLDGAERLTGVQIYRSGASIQCSRHPTISCYRIPLEAGFYYVLNNNEGRGLNALVETGSNITWETIRNVAQYGETATLNVSYYTGFTHLDGMQSYMVDGSAGSHLILSFGDVSLDSNAVYRMESMKAVSTYSLPENWNPYALLGAEPSPNHDGTFVGGVGSVFFDAVTFRSNGMVWNEIYIETLDMEQKLVGWYDVNGKLQYKRVMATGAKAIASVTYSLTGQSTQASQLVMQYKRVLIDVDGQSEYVYLAQGARYWTSPLYRKIDVLFYNVDEWSPSAEYLPATPDLWLERSLADKTTFDPNAWGDPNENVNVFSMIALAFSSMMPFLGIQIFPSMTLGLLIVLPLIGGIIILIIKAVSK